MKKRYRSLKVKLIVTFCGFTFFISLFFGAFNFMLVYVVEDAFIMRMLKEEAVSLTIQYENTGRWSKPENKHYQLYFSEKELPQLIQLLLVEEPQRLEFYGEDGKHYHLHRMAIDNSVFLVAEVSDELVVRKFKKTILFSLLIITLIIAVVACFIAFRLAKKTLSPLTRLSTMFSDASTNHLPRNFADKFPNNEIGILANALDSAAQRSDAFVERELQFTRDASHELRTPIAIVSGAIELLNKETEFSEQTGLLIKRIEEANLNMSQTVQALLTLAREENVPRPESGVNVLPILEKVIVNAAYLLADKKVELKVELPSEFSMRVQPTVLEIILWNLISNAFQYTQQGEVTIYLTQNKLTISDSGIGIDHQLKDKVLEPMVKGPLSKGFGIGLSIVKRLCQQQNLELDIENLEGGTKISISEV